MGPDVEFSFHGVRPYRDPVLREKPVTPRQSRGSSFPKKRSDLFFAQAPFVSNRDLSVSNGDPQVSNGDTNKNNNKIKNKKTTTTGSTSSAGGGIDEIWFGKLVNRIADVCLVQVYVVLQPLQRKVGSSQNLVVAQK